MKILITVKGELAIKNLIKTLIKRMTSIGASIKDSPRNLFNLIYSIVFIFQVLAFLFFVVVFGTYTNRYFSTVDMIFIGLFSIYSLANLIESPKNISNIYHLAVFVVYLWIMFTHKEFIPHIHRGSAEQGIRFLMLSLRIGFFVGTIIANKRGRIYLTGSFKLRSAQSFVIGFLLVILVGSLMLSLPISVKDEGKISYIDALFTSTSAVCVTGLIVVDTGSYYTTFGQVVIVILIQIGGLGIMSFGSFIALLVGSKMSLTSQNTSLEIFDQNSMQNLKALIKTIIIGTFLIELAGAFSLFFSIDTNSLVNPTVGYKAYYSVFHSISAFCNAGFSLNYDNLTPFASNGVINVTVMSLIVLGGIGFPIMLNVRNYFYFKARNQFSAKSYSNIVVKLQTKIVITVTMSLIVCGAIFFLIFEWNNVISGYSIPQKILRSFFQSVTTRTAGFNTVDIGALQETTYLMFLLLMLIGASPGSTGGGIKTTTFFVLLKTTTAAIRGTNDVATFGKRINKDIITRSIAILFSYSFIIVLATAILLITEKFSMLPIIFEVISAIATVGLSAGITGDLSVIGRIVITIVMFAGRMGVLTFLLVFFKPLKDNRLTYPEETLSVG